jgi:hypothetical protein
MPTHNKNRGGDDNNGKVRIRWMEVEVEGSNETIMDGIRQITSTMPTKVIRRQVGNGVAPKALSNGAGSEATDESESAFEEAAEEEAHADADSEETPASGLKRPRGPRSVAKSPPLAENLHPNDDPSLKGLVGQTTVTGESSDADRTIVIATWLKEDRKQDSINASELFTCCKFLGWPPPIDPTAPMRTLKRSGDQRMRSVKGKPGTFQLTSLGDQHFVTLKKK